MATRNGLPPINDDTMPRSDARLWISSVTLMKKASFNFERGSENQLFDWNNRVCTATSEIPSRAGAILH